MQNHLDPLDLFIGRRMKNNDYSADKANGAAQLAQCTELLLQEVGSQDGTYQYAKGSQGSDEDRRRKCVRGKIADFANGHCEPMLARVIVTERRCLHVAIPAHHRGFFRYTNPSPSKP